MPTWYLKNSKHKQMTVMEIWVVEFQLLRDTKLGRFKLKMKRFQGNFDTFL